MSSTPNLLSILQGKVQNGVLDLTALLPDPEQSALKDAFQLAESLSFNVPHLDELKTTDSNVTLTVTETFSLLNLVSISLTIETVFSGTSLDDLKVLVKVSLPNNWTAGQTFPDLKDIFPFSHFDIGTGTACFIYSTHTSDQTLQVDSYTDPTTSKPKDVSISIKTGMNFYLRDLSGFTQMPGISTLEPLFKASNISTLLQDLELYGSFQPPGDNPYPVVDIKAKIGETLKIDTPLGTDFNLSAPSLRFQITEPNNNIQNFLVSVESTLNGQGNDQLGMSVYLSQADKEVKLVAKPVQGSQFTATDITSLLPGAGDYTSYIPSEVESTFSDIYFDYFNLKLNLGSVGSGPHKTNALKSLYLGLSAGIPGTPASWTIFDELVVNNVTLDLSKLNIGSTQVETAGLSAKGQILPDIFASDFDFTIDLEKKTKAPKKKKKKKGGQPAPASKSSWQINKIAAQYNGSVKVIDIVNAIDNGAGNALPEVFQTLEFSDFYLTVDEAKEKWSCGTSLDFTLELDDVQLISTATLSFSEAKKPQLTKDWSINGQLIIGDYTFSYKLEKGGEGSSITVTGVDTGTPLGFNTLLQTLGFQEEIPSNLDIDLTQASFTYDFTNKVFDFTITSATYGTSSLVKNSDGIIVYFKPNFTLGSGQIPLVGSELKGLLEFDDIGLILTTETVSADDIGNYSSLGLPSGITSLDHKGIYLTATIKALGGSQSVDGLIYSFDSTRKVGRPSLPGLPTGGGGGTDNGSPGSGNQPASATPATGANSGGGGSAKVFTISIKKQLGPVYLDSLGFSYENDVLNIIFNASLSLGTISMGFDDLEIGSPLSHFDPHGSLKGLSMGYHTDDVTIEGAFVHDGAEYNGMFVLSLTKFQLAAIGSYEDNHGSPSIFLYGVLDEPLGGPAFMFVEGLAVAFGYNRAFIAPPVTAVSTFPLITAAQKVDVTSVSTANLTSEFAALEKFIPPQHGEYFIGLGIKFMSFKVINSFALLIGEFGKELQFDLLGVSTYVAPDPKDPNPTAVVELEIVGTYIPAKGSVIVRGQLTPDSFVLSKKCHLQGGFAIAFWTKSGQPHDGEFVFSFGGYGNHYTPKSYYPQGIPQLQFLWQVNSQVSIKGGGYWALTPKEIVAGGFLKATYQNGWVKACFDANAYFLIHWAPLYYQAGFTVSFSLSVKVDLLFCSVWLGFEISEQLRLHGPPFGGAAGISLYVATIWIHFGAKKGAAPLLSWSKFAQKHLPKPDPTANHDKDQVMNIDIVGGLLKRVGKEGDYTYYVNPKELHITTGSFVPTTSFDLPAGTVDGTGFTIKPMGDAFPKGAAYNSGAVAATENSSTHKVTVTGTDASTALSCTVAPTKKAPASMWYATQTDGKVPAENTTELHFGTEIKPTSPAKADRTSFVPRKDLVDSQVAGPDYALADLKKFNGAPTSGSDCATGMTSSGDLATGTFSQLDSVFSLSGTSSSDFTGLKTRLQKIGATNISKGTLYKAS